MTEVGIAVNDAEQLMDTLKKITQSSPRSTDNRADISIHAFALKKAERKKITHNINLTNMNKLMVEFTQQNTTITDLTGKVGRLEKLTKNNRNFESRVKILEILTVENISQVPRDIVDTKSANLNTTSSIYLSHHDTSISTRHTKRRKKMEMTHGPHGLHSERPIKVVSPTHQTQR